MKDLYKILGVSQDANADVIKKAYRKLAKENHPDATGGDKKKTERFKEVNEAYTVISDQQKRREYDRLRSAPVGADGMPEGFDPDAFAQVFGGGGAQAGGFGDLGDMFANLFGNAGPFTRGRGRGRAQARGADMVGNLEVTFKDAALGVRQTIRSGSGKSVAVNIPAGVETGARLRVPGQGAPAPKSGQPGDLYLDIVVRSDAHLRRNDDDVELALPLTLGEAVLGTQVDVPTLDGTVRLTVPAGTSSDAKLRLRGKGIKRPDGVRGDQLCHVEIVVPRLKPDDVESRRLVEELENRTRPQKVRAF
ncbi:MAG TPA: DnaJ C-terminal domain-containing protein [Polyangia bacterium]|jgi:DnaJ-class molecular chaperone with C-terminal Zn finger domain|nr:DnaJ C-terminal domain-containing protein [Polyangia bacterium]